MTLFYYPDCLEVMLAVSKCGTILCPYLYELMRLYRLQESRNPDDRKRFDDYVWSYLRPTESLSDLAMHVAAIRHPVDIRLRTENMPSEEEWLKSVRLYSNLSIALQYVQNLPSGCVLGIELDHPPQELLFLPDSVKLENQLKQVHVRADEKKRFMVVAAFNHYLPQFFRITENH